MTIKSAHAKTCKWLFQHTKYLDWLNVNNLDEHHGFFWIKGKAGAGKSTLLKSAVANTRKDKNCTTIAFFFSAQGDEIKRSTSGMYRSLLLQLLERTSVSQKTLSSLDIPKSDLTADSH